MRFHALAEGPETGPLVLLLHGFPELARSWRHQLPVLAAAGYRAVAPDLRGYGETEKRGPYDVRTLAADVAGLVRALHRERATVVGHDCGGAGAWINAHCEPDAAEAFVILNCPHPAAMNAELFRNPKQLARSAYILFFQLPALPEWVLTRRRAATVAGALDRAGFPRDEVERYREALLQPGAASAALAYYRAAFRRPLEPRRAARAHPIAAPTLVLWGVRDRLLGEELIRPDRLQPWFAPGNTPDVRRLAEAGHFVQNEAPARVNAELLAWLRDRT